jgi:hypothetical protein
MSDLYESDILEWSGKQADRLRRLAAEEPVDERLDWTNKAEEIEALGTGMGRELASRVGVILVHLIKLEASPAAGPRAGWRSTIRSRRVEIERLLKDAPSLRPTVGAVIAQELADARREAGASLADDAETPRVDPAAVTYSEDRALGDWLP